jgi:hypothetical protein
MVLLYATWGTFWTSLPAFQYIFAIIKEQNTNWLEMDTAYKSLQWYERGGGGSTYIVQLADRSIMAIKKNHVYIAAYGHTNTYQNQTCGVEKKIVGLLK